MPAPTILNLFPHGDVGDAAYHICEVNEELSDLDNANHFSQALDALEGSMPAMRAAVDYYGDEETNMEFDRWLKRWAAAHMESDHVMAQWERDHAAVTAWMDGAEA